MPRFPFPRSRAAFRGVTRHILAAALPVTLVAMLTAASEARGDVVVLASGDVLNGQVTAQNEESVTLEHPLLGTLTLPAADVASVTISDETQAESEAPAAESQEPVQATAPGTTAPADATPAEEADELDEPVKPGLFGTGLLQGWTREFEVGVFGEAGVNESLDITARVRAEYEDDHKRWIFDSGVLYGEEEGEQTDGEFDALLRRDWLVPDQPVFYFAQGGYDYDNFESWEHRLRGSGGVGYEFLNDETYELNGRLGAGLLAEFGGSQDDDVVPEGLAGVDFSWNVREGHVFTAFNNFYPQLEDLGEFRNVTGLEYTIEIDREDGLSFKVGVENEHDSTDAEKNDFVYYSTLVIGF